MDELVLLAGLVLCVGAAVASAWFARKNNVRELQEQLDLVSEWAEKAARDARSARMRAVRAATREDSSNTPPPEFKPQAELGLPTDPREVKKALREKLRLGRLPPH